VMTHKFPWIFIKQNHNYLDGKYATNSQMFSYSSIRVWWLYKTVYRSLVCAGLIDFPERSSLSLNSLATS